MKKITLFVAAAAFVLMSSVAVKGEVSSKATASYNYPPDNQNVQLTQTNLPIVWLEVNGQQIDREERKTARMKIIYNGEGQLNYADTVAHPGQAIDYDGYIALRYRGNSSFTMSDKKPYSIRPLNKPLEEGGKKQKVKILGMAKDNDWALLAPYNDKSMMRDLLAFELSRPWMDFTPHGKYCEVFLDGTYYGVYIMIETVTKGKNRVDLDDPGAEGDDLTGGYMLEVDRNDETVYTSKYHPLDNSGNPITYRNIYYQYKEPDYEDMTADQLSYIQGRIDLMEGALSSSNFADPEQGYRQYLDELSFVDYQLAQEFAHNVDAYRLSAKIFKRRDSVDPRFKMVLWDFNLGYGNSDYYNGWYTNTWIWQNNDLLNWNNDSQLVPLWWYKLNQDPYYTDLLKSRWAQYRHTNFSEESLMALVDSMANELTAQGAEARNSQAWPRWNQYVWPNQYIAQNFDDEISHLKWWMKERLAWMDQQLEYDPNAFPMGDANHDGAVDVNDVTTIINYILNKNPDPFFYDDANINGDGAVDVMDITLIINMILGV
ncbi:MAG: CotH kinase family protein [Muribaculaceae bacterium]|nr:CotH kinase family protein [Muribaculaceae bacterium]